MYRMITKSISLAGSLALLLAGGCGIESDEQIGLDDHFADAGIGQGLSDEERQERLSSLEPGEVLIDGELLDTVTYDAEHFIQFWQLRDGTVMTLESAAVDAEGYDGPLFADLDADEGVTVLDLYRIADPDISEANIPVQIREASRRVELLEIAPAQTPQTELMVASALPFGSSETPDWGTNAPRSTASCTPDYYNDNYGAQWFKDHFCNQGEHQWCPTNHAEIYSGRHPSTWFQISVMAADFHAGGVLLSEYWHTASHCSGCPAHYHACTGPTKLVLPRHIETVTFVGAGEREAWAVGFDPCKRVHMAKKWND